MDYFIGVCDAGDLEYLLDTLLIVLESPRQVLLLFCLALRGGLCGCNKLDFGDIFKVGYLRDCRDGAASSEVGAELEGALVYLDYVDGVIVVGEETVVQASTLY